MDGNKTFKYFGSSRLFLYYNSLFYDKTADESVSVFFRDVYKAMKKCGICTEAFVALRRTENFSEAFILQLSRWVGKFHRQLSMS